MSKTSLAKISSLDKKRIDSLFSRVSAILDEARAAVGRSVNTVLTQSYWFIGCEIVEEEQHGKDRAAYGERVIAQLSRRLMERYGKGYTETNLRYMRLFYQTYPRFLKGPIRHAMSDKSPTQQAMISIRHPARDKSWPTGSINPNLSWTHYRLLTKVESSYARSFYEVEAARNHWSSRELGRQINSLLFERLAKSRDKKGLLKLALKGQEIETPADVIKDPVVLEFLDIPESHKLVESDLEEALTNDLQNFLLELGKGFAFVARQHRLTLDGDHFYVDLVFYHAILKCYILVDLKVAKLSHADIGQMLLYVNYFDEARRTLGDNPTIGLILCTDKNEAVVRYAVGKKQQRIFASSYKLHLPSEKELATEIKRELKALRKQAEAE